MSVTINGTTGIVSPHIETTTSSAGSADIGVLNGGQFAFRNKIINGKMEIAQRGTSFPAATSGTFPVDRWHVSFSNAAAITANQAATVPNSEFQYSAGVQVTTSDPSIAAGDYCLITQAIEGYNARDLIGKPFTISFWVRSSKTGIHCVAFRNNGADRSYVAEYTVSAANSWEFKTITVASGLQTDGSWDWTTGVGVLVRFCLAGGSTYQTTPNEWFAGTTRFATSNQVNVLDTVGNTFYVTGVQLEVGEVATPFEHRPYGTELTMCQRYFEYVSMGRMGLGPMIGSVVTRVVKFNATKRIAPTVTCTVSSIDNAAAGNGTVERASVEAFVHTQGVANTGFPYNNINMAYSANAEL